MNLLLDNKSCIHRPEKMICVGRNYADHAKELNNPLPKEPLLFMKPFSCGVDFAGEIAVPVGLGAVHHELEIALLLGEAEGTKQPPVVGLGLALDLTLRDVQQHLKALAQPWERAKSFPGACPLSTFVSPPEGLQWQDLHFTFYKNNHIQQAGSSGDMLFPVTQLLEEIAATFSLCPGDIILTGTPKGVGPLNAGDNLSASLHYGEHELVKAEAKVV